MRNAHGQHVDVRLTAPDGYNAVRSYSIASAPQHDRLELTVEDKDDGLRITYAYTRAVPADSSRRPHRVDAATITEAVWPVSALPTCYVCGPTAFETIADLLIAAGHSAARVKTKRFGPSGPSARAARPDDAKVVN